MKNLIIAVLFMSVVSGLTQDVLTQANGAYLKIATTTKEATDRLDVQYRTAKSRILMKQVQDLETLLSAVMKNNDLQTAVALNVKIEEAKEELKNLELPKVVNKIQGPTSTIAGDWNRVSPSGSSNLLCLHPSGKAYHYKDAGGTWSVNKGVVKVIWSTGYTDTWEINKKDSQILINGANNKGTKLGTLTRLD